VAVAVSLSLAEGRKDEGKASFPKVGKKKRGEKRREELLPVTFQSIHPLSLSLSKKRHFPQAENGNEEVGKRGREEERVNARTPYVGRLGQRGRQSYLRTGERTKEAKAAKSGNGKG